MDFLGSQILGHPSRQVLFPVEIIYFQCKYWTHPNNPLLVWLHALGIEHTVRISTFGPEEATSLSNHVGMCASFWIVFGTKFWEWDVQLYKYSGIGV